MRRQSWLKKSKKKTKKEVSVEEVLEEVEKNLEQDENKIQQRDFERRLRWAMEDE